ncbi:MAG: chemotaxis protein CheB, partial [Gammaproteobacteria bacterium]|nr:chemotaxis protein CheB [Gammaproteobacteria bacterium]
ERHNIINRVKIAADENIENIRRVRLCKVDVRKNLVKRYGLNQLECLVTLGTTLGGPNSIIGLMSALSPDIPAAVVVIQEISPKILPAFVEQFNDYTQWKVEVAHEGAVLEPGVCYMCAYNEPLIAKANENGEICLQKGSSSDQPLDDLFTSAAELFDRNCVGVLMTGVGDDGSSGFKAIQDKSGTTIAQKFETCVYPNLTHSAIQNKVVDHVIDAPEIARKIESVLQARTSEN